MHWKTPSTGAGGTVTVFQSGYTPGFISPTSASVPSGPGRISVSGLSRRTVEMKCLYWV